MSKAIDNRPSLEALEPRAQQYDWGQRGSKSKVFQLLNKNREWLQTLEAIAAPKNKDPTDKDDDAVDVDDDAVDDADNQHKTWAELWMGTHSRGPSTVCVPSSPSSNESLADWISSRTSAAEREREEEKEKSSLPFLFKVLSVRTPLSIQAHPDLLLARRLHKDAPELYPDPNHKPELACALTPFEALVGFLSLPEISFNLSSLAPELSALLSDCGASQAVSYCQSLAGSDEEPSEEKTKEILRELFGALMTAPLELVRLHLDSLIRRLVDLETSLDSPCQPLSDQWLQDVINEIETEKRTREDERSSEEKRKTEERLLRLRVLRVHSFFPGDVGVFCLYFLRSVRLEPGEAVYLGPNEPHCYLYGDCIECMACSDNVVRAGLTPKYRDASTLVSMLTYRVDQSHRVVPVQLSSPDHQKGTVWRYETEASKEFVLFRATVPASSEFDIGQSIASSPSPRTLGPSIVLVVEGEGTLKTSSSLISLQSGSVVFVYSPLSSSLSDLVVSSSSQITLFVCSFEVE